MSFSINGKTAIVTGAANGIGLAIARHFADHGANVMFADMDEASLIDEIGEQAEGENSNVRYFAGDLREKLTQMNLLSATIDAFDEVNILVNASRQVLTTNPLDRDDDSMAVLLEQNLLTSYRLSQVIACRMIKQAGNGSSAANGDDHTPAGAIINLSSIAAQRAHPELLGYSVSVAAQDQMTRALALALAPHRIRVNAVAFGSVMSASLQDTLRDDEEKRRRIIANTPLGHIAGPGELAEAVQFLASDASGFMTGQVLTVDGGRTLADTVASTAH